MEHRESYLELLSADSYKHQIDIWYRTYNISYEKTLLYYDFVTSLYALVEETYLGSDILVLEVDQKNHFNWCWDKTISNFEKEKISFKERDNCYHYFLNFFLEAYYYAKAENQEVRISEYFYRLFDFTHKKTRSELDMLTDVYKIFDQNLKK